MSLRTVASVDWRSTWTSGARAHDDARDTLREAWRRAEYERLEVAGADSIVVVLKGHVTTLFTR
jgi:hypothetical protein